MRVFRCGFWVLPANPCFGLWWLCLRLGFAFSLPMGRWAVCVSVHGPPVPYHSWLTFVVCVSGFEFCVLPASSGLPVGVCVSGFGFCFHPANHGLAVGMCVSGFGFAFTPLILAGVSGPVGFCARSVCTPPFLDEVCGVCVLVWL